MFGLCKFFNKLVCKDPIDVLHLQTDRVEWHRDGQLHRDNGPAIEWHDGTKEWWRDGKRHRDDGPAIERNCGCRAWYTNGVLKQAEGEDGVKIYPSGKVIPKGDRRCHFKG